MSDRAIYCHKCRHYLGVIRDAKLRKGIVHVCGECADKGKDSGIDALLRGMGVKA